MRYYLIEVTTYTDKDNEDKGMYAYDDYNKALSTFHTKMGGMMNRETTKTEYCFIVDDIGNMIVCEKYVKPGTDIKA